jgi:hypothetical protein
MDGGEKGRVTNEGFGKGNIIEVVFEIRRENRNREVYI